MRGQIGRVFVGCTLGFASTESRECKLKFLSGGYVKLSKDAMLVIVWFKATICLDHGCNLFSISAYDIVVVIHVRTYLVPVDAVIDKCNIASIDVIDGLDVNGINYVSIFIGGDGAPESGLDL